MLKQRVITGIIGLLVAIMAISFGGLLYDSLIIALALLGWREYTSMLGNANKEVAPIWGYAFTLLVMIPLSLSMYKIGVVMTVFSVMTLGFLYIFSSRYFSFTRVANSVFGFFYVIGGFSSLLLLRDNTLYQYFDIPHYCMNQGIIIIWMILLCTWASDTFAYFTGIKWGRRKIVPQISPNKSLEGFIGGFVGCVLMAIIYGFILGIPATHALIIGLLIGIFAPCGDLFESKLKRNCSIKDSGVLLPGHGGVLDRFDSLLFAVPLVMIYLLLL